MPIKNKKYKRKCLNCKQKFDPPFPNSVVCGIPCSVEYSKKVSVKKWKVEKKERKEKLKTVGDLKKEAKAVFQKWVRLRDAKDGCISCGRTKVVQFHGGHYLKSEVYSGLIFHEDNCHKQCSQCNDLYSGNEVNYRIGLIAKIGEDRVKWLEENRDRLKVYKYSKDELKLIKETYKSKIKMLENLDK